MAQISVFSASASASYSDNIAKMKLDMLRRHHLKAWRKRLEQAPALVTRTKVADLKRIKPRSQSTVNRDMVPLRAARGMARWPRRAEHGRSMARGAAPTQGG